ASRQRRRRPRRGGRGRDRDAPVRARPSRSRPPHPHRRRAARLELPAVGGRVRGDVGDAGALARLRGQGSRRGPRLVRVTRTTIRPLMRDLPRRTATAIVYGAVVLLAIAAPPIVFWILLAAVAVVGLAELVALRAGAAPAALFLAGLVSLGLLRAYGSAGAHHAIAGELPVWLFLVLVPTWAADVAA